MRSTWNIQLLIPAIGIDRAFLLWLWSARCRQYFIHSCSTRPWLKLWIQNDRHAIQCYFACLIVCLFIDLPATLISPPLPLTLSITPFRPPHYLYLTLQRPDGLPPTGSSIHSHQIINNIRHSRSFPWILMPHPLH